MYINVHCIKMTLLFKCSMRGFSIMFSGAGRAVYSVEEGMSVWFFCYLVEEIYPGMQLIWISL